MEPTAHKAKRAMRRDARARRDALIDAAAYCFGQFGYLVPLEDVATRAGVGRGTLYRNFKDRFALALAVFDRQVDAFEHTLDPSMSLEAALMMLMRQGALGSALFARVAAEMPMDPDNMAALSQLGERSRGIIAPLVARAQANGLLAAELQADDVLAAARMVSGLLRRHMSPVEQEEQITRGLHMVMNGLRPR